MCLLLFLRLGATGLNETERQPQTLEDDAQQRFGEDVTNHLFSRAVVNVNYGFGELLSHKEMAERHVLGTLVEPVVTDYLQCGLVVLVNQKRLSTGGELELDGQLLQPDGFARAVR